MASPPLRPRKPNRQLQMYQPGQSSPLSGLSSPTYSVESRRKRQYKPQGSSRSSLPAPSLLGAFDDTPQKKFLRERFKAQCLERARKGRGRAVQKRREITHANGSSSDSFDMDDDLMDGGDDDDVFNDEIYRRVMLNEERRSQYVKRVSFEQDVGSSIDPNMYDDMEALEWEYTGHASKSRTPSPPDDELDDALIQEYLSELEELEQWESRQSAAPTGVIDTDREDFPNLDRAVREQSSLVEKH